MFAYQDQCAQCSHNQNEQDFDIAKNLFLIVVSLILFACGLIFNRQLHETPVLEYGLFLFVYFLTGRLVLFNALRNIAGTHLHRKYQATYYIEITDNSDIVKCAVELIKKDRIV